MTARRKTAAKDAKPAVFRVARKRIEPGTMKRIDVPVSLLATGDQLSLPILVLNGIEEGPGLWLSGAIHGDEVVGVAIIRRVLDLLDVETLRGHVIAAPIVNVFGFTAGSRYLPDRRDLNRVFPGRSRGSMASRLAHLLMKEVVARCDYGIDLHAGSDDRINHPQIRANLDDEETRRIAEAFAAPIMIHGRPPKGALREAAARQGKKVLLFEGGEPRRFSEDAVEVGVIGVLRVMRALDMGPKVRMTRRRLLASRSTTWVRATQGGIFWRTVDEGRRVRKGQKLGAITGPYGIERQPVVAPVGGMVIGHTINPVVNRGDALVHLAQIEKS